jgi:hypothetical protein
MEQYMKQCDEATIARKLLLAADIEPEGFLQQLAKARKQSVECATTAFISQLNKLFNNGGSAVNLLENPAPIMALRAIHLESGNPIKTANILEKINVLQDVSASGRQKVGAAINLAVNGRSLSKHYTGVGIGSILRNALRFVRNKEPGGGDFPGRVLRWWKGLRGEKKGWMLLKMCLNDSPRNIAVVLPPSLTYLLSSG